GDVAYVSPRPAGDQVVTPRGRSGLRPCGLLRVGWHARPYRQLRVPRRRLPGGRLRAETAGGKHERERHDGWLHGNPSWRSVTVKIEAVSVQVLNGELPQTPGLFLQWLHDLRA